jgi:nucleoside-diphosphate-sugar epimerase
MTRPALQDIALVGRSSALRPSLGTLLRISTDIGCVWIGFMFAWHFVAGRDAAALVNPTFAHIIPLVAILSVSACIAYAGAGLYACPRSRALLPKFWAIFSVTLVLFTIAGAVLWLAEVQTTSTFGLLFTTLAGSAILACFARIVTFVLRTEERGQSTNESLAEPTDEMKVLVIGGAGYIGSALVQKLLKLGFRVSVFDALHFGESALSGVAGHPNLTVIREDFRHIEALTRSMSGNGSVIHLGGLVGDPACALKPDITIDVNVTATKVIGEIAKACGVRRFIFASSCSVYGACDEIVEEDSRFNPQSLYARSKIASEAVLGHLNSPDFAVTCLRFATIYGISGRTRFDLVVNLLCAKAVRDGIITVFGADQWRPFVHVEDVANAIVMTLKAPISIVAGQAFNVGSDAQNCTLGNVAELIRSEVPSARIVSDDTFVDRRNYRVSFKKIRSLLGFAPIWTLEQGIAQVCALVRSNEVGHYSLPTYSNVLHLKENGTERFSFFRIAGWENELMGIDRIASDKLNDQSVAAQRTHDGDSSATVFAYPADMQSRRQPIPHATAR